MSCATHPDRDDVSACSVCRQPLCQSCLFYANSEPYCRSCVSILEREHLEIHKRRVRRTILAAPVGTLVAAAVVLGWRWLLMQTDFAMALFTPVITIGVILGAAQVITTMVGDRSVPVFSIGLALTLGILLGGEFITYDYKLFSAAQQGLSAEKLLRYSEQNTFQSHLAGLGVFDYLFFLIGIFLTWRRLWPMRSDELSIIRPTELE